MDLVDDIEPVPPVEFKFRMTDDELAALDRVAGTLDMPMDSALRELIRRAVPSANGHGFQAICDHCGLPYTSFHRPKADVKHYCQREECKREAAAERARRYRDRKAKSAS